VGDRQSLYSGLPFAEVRVGWAAVEEKVGFAIQPRGLSRGLIPF